MKSKFLLFLVVILAVCLTQFASDLYAPSVPSIAESLESPVDLVQWSMAIYMFGVAASQLIYGPISEGIGRKKPLLVGLIIMLIGSLLSLFANTIDSLIWGRLIQGCGAGACSALWRPIFRDVFAGPDLAKWGSYFVIFITFIVPAAPALGGFMQETWGWRSVFIFMTVYTLISIAAIFLGYQETNLHFHKERLKLTWIFQTYKDILTSPVFMGITCCTFLCYGAFFSWFVSGPVLLIEYLKISPSQFGYMTFFGGGAAYGLSGWVNGRFVKRFGMGNMMRLGWICMFASGVLLILNYFLLGLNILGIALPVLLSYFGSTFIWPNAFAIAFTPFGKIAGYAGALYGFFQLGGAAVIGGIVSYLPDNTPIPLGCLLIIASLPSWMIYTRVVERNNSY